MSERTYDLEESTANERSTLSFPVDSDAFTKTKKLTFSNFLKTIAIEGQAGSLDETQALTSKSFSETTATVTRLGVSRLSTDAVAIAATDSVRSLVPSNLNPIFDARFKKTKSYVVGDFDEVAGNYTTLDITSFDEMVVGNYTQMQGYIIVTIPEVDNIEILLNATQTPLTIKAINTTRFVSTFYTSHGGVCLTSGGKLKMIIGTGDNTSWSPGTYEFAIDLSYFSE